MKSSEAAIKIKNALNKLDSSDYQDIPLEKLQEAVNKARLTICRQRIPAKESTDQLVDDIQPLLKPPTRLSGTDKGIYFESEKLPSDYFAMSRISPVCTKGKCISVLIKSDLVEDSNVDTYLSDWSKQPSFELEQTFHTIGSDRVYQYHNKEFKVKELSLTYYRIPQYIQFPGAYMPDGNQGKDMEWEFKDDFCELIIDEAIKILAGSIENVNAYSIYSQSNKK